MKITVENTTATVEFNGVPARVWEGHTESGIRVHCFITRIAVLECEDLSQFEAELIPVRPPSPDVEAYPMRMVL